MAEGMTNKQIELGIKKLLNFGFDTKGNEGSDVTIQQQQSEGVSFVPLNIAGDLSKGVNKDVVKQPSKGKVESESKTEKKNENKKSQRKRDNHGSSNEWKEDSQVESKKGPPISEGAEDNGKKAKAKKKKRKTKESGKDGGNSESPLTEIKIKALSDESIILLQTTKQDSCESFFCLSCQKHLPSFSDCENHVQEKTHMEQLKVGLKKERSDVVQGTQRRNETPQREKEKTSKETSEKGKGKMSKESTSEKKKGKLSKEDISQKEKEKVIKGNTKPSDVVERDKSNNGKLDDKTCNLDGIDKNVPINVALKELEKEKIYPLKKKSSRFPRAKFFCRLCDYHMDALEDVEKHVKDGRHRSRNMASEMERKLQNMPSPLVEQIAALDKMVQEVHADYSLSEADVEYRSKFTSQLQDFLRKNPNLADIKLCLFGSSLTSLGLRESDINIDLLVPTAVNQAKALTIAFKMMKETDMYSNVHSDFAAKIPCVQFIDPVKKIPCQLTIACDTGVHTSRLLALYARCDPRVQKLSVTFRYWAKECKVDKQDEGTLPAYCISLMTVYFLQQCNPPVLPILLKRDNEECQSPVKNKKPTAIYDIDFDKLREKAENWKSLNTDSIGTLWLKLLKFYSLTFEHTVHIVSIKQKKLLLSAEKKWNTKKLAIEDPFFTKRNVTRTIKSFDMFDYIWSCIRKAYYYFGLPTNYSTLTAKQTKALMDYSKTHGVFKHENYAKRWEKDGDKLNTIDVPQGSSVGNMNCQDKVDDGGDDAEDIPVTFPSTSSADESTQGASSHENHDIVGDKGKQRDITLCPSDCDKNSIDNSCSTNSADLESVEDTSKEISSDSHSLQTFAMSIVNQVLTDACSVLGQKWSSPHSNGNTEDLNKVSSENSQNKKFNVIEENHTEVSDKTSVKEESETVSLPSLEYQYKFSQETLMHGKGPAVICVLCEKEGHLKNCCPDDKIPELKPLPPMTDKHVNLLTSVLKQVPKDFEQCLEEIRDREFIRQELEKFIQELYPDAQLHLFGSSRNGFGFNNSDLDLCVTFKGKPTAEGLDLVQYIEEITAKLKTHRGLYNVFPIPTAKVPIVKFRHRRSQLEGDISMYNLLALHNTRMVEMYAFMDSRVRILGYALKVFAKICEIGDASRGSLSSYAYILILIYYLQQCQPPVLPVLQELHPGSNRPEKIIDGCNAWFYEDMQNLPKVWSGFGKNQQSVGKLWIGLFRFYTETFNLRDHVVCIRQLELLTRFEKLWNGKCIAIEDPFDLSHNLGGGLSHKMNQYIMKCFVYGRQLYGTPIKDIPTGFNDIADFFFDKEQLTEGCPPNDRCCRACNKIGHIAKECPIVQNRKNREERERKRRDENRKNEEKMKKFEIDQKRKQESFIRQQEQNVQHYPRAIKRSLSESSDKDIVSHVQPQPGFFDRNMRSVSMPAGYQHDAAHVSPSSSPRGINRGQNSWQIQQLGGMSPTVHNNLPEYPQNKVNQALFTSGRPHTSPMKSSGSQNSKQGMFQQDPQVHSHPWIQQVMQQHQHHQQQQPHQQQQHHPPFSYNGHNSQVDNGLSNVSSSPSTTNVIPCALVSGMYYPLCSLPAQVPRQQQGAPLFHGVNPIYHLAAAPPQPNRAQGPNRQFNTNRSRGDNSQSYNLGVTVQNEFYRGGNSENQGISPKPSNRQYKNQRRSQYK